MSAGGLIANALLGGLAGGAKASYEIGERERKQSFQIEREELAEQREQARLKMRHQFETELAETKHGYNMELARLQNQGKGSDKLNPYIAAQLEGVDNKLKSLYKAQAEGMGEDYSDQIAQLEATRTFLLGGGAPSWMLGGDPQAGSGGAGSGGKPTDESLPEPKAAAAAPEAPASAGGGLLNPAVQAERERQERNNEAMGGMFDRLGSWAGSYTDRSEAEAVWYRRTGNKADPSNPQFLEFAKQNYPGAYNHYTRNVE